MKIELNKPLYIHELGKRDNQEDAITQWNNRLFIVCDGMGGHNHSEIASQTFSGALAQWFEENITVSDAEFTDEQLSDAIEFAYDQLDLVNNSEDLWRMGTTLTLLYIHARGITAAHIGDSRIYHLRPSEGIIYQSRDHSLVFEKYRAGEISYDEMATHPKKNVITRAVTPGEENRAHPDIVHITDIKPGDYFYMCSDGMLEQMNNGKLMELFSSEASDEEKREILIRETSDNSDNHTAWILHVKSVRKEAGDVPEELDEERTSNYNAIFIQKKINSERNSLEHVQAADEGDVIVVGNAATGQRQQRAASANSNLTKQKKTKRNSLIWIMLSILVISAITVEVVRLSNKESKEKVTEKKKETGTTIEKAYTPKGNPGTTNTFPRTGSDANGKPNTNESNNGTNEGSPGKKTNGEEVSGGDNKKDPANKTKKSIPDNPPKGKDSDEQKKTGPAPSDDTETFDSATPKDAQNALDAINKGGKGNE